MSFYFIEDLEQGSLEWHAWRRGVIGASDAATIMGENPWASAQRLLEEKLGLHRAFGGNAATREGHKLEEFAREALEKKYKHKMSFGHKKSSQFFKDMSIKIKRNLRNKSREFISKFSLKQMLE